VAIKAIHRAGQLIVRIGQGHSLLDLLRGAQWDNSPEKPGVNFEKSLFFKTRQNCASLMVDLGRWYNLTFWTAFTIMTSALKVNILMLESHGKVICGM
jgi:hypothetical protein